MEVIYLGFRYRDFKYIQNLFKVFIYKNEIHNIYSEYINEWWKREMIKELEEWFTLYNWLYFTNYFIYFNELYFKFWKFDFRKDNI